MYIEEIEQGVRSIEGVSTSTAGFLGETERGPTTPKLITSWLQYQRVYGNYIQKDAYLPYAVKGFFDNGGKRCYISRITAQDATPASNEITTTEGAEQRDVLTVQAIGEGSWGKRIAIKVEEGTLATAKNPLYKLTFFYWNKTFPDPLFDPDDNPTQTPSPTVREDFDNISVDTSSPDYFGSRINDVSNLVTLSLKPCDSKLTSDKSTSFDALTGGSDGGNIELEAYLRTDTDNLGQRKGLTALGEIDEISIVYAPNSDNVNGLTDAIISHCENLQDRFAITEASQGSSNIDDIKPRDGNDTKYAAFYYPWLKIIDPVTNLEKLIPPGGHVAGIYARSDTKRGVHKAPANETVRGIIGLEFHVTQWKQDILNPRGVNVIRSFPGRGIRVWGARTLSSDSLWKYVNVRRLFIFLEESIEEGTRWVVFEPNDERLWARVKQSISQFLVRVWKDGALMGTTPEDAFFVKCDRTTMTQDDIDNGKLIVVIGVAPVKPAEFIIFRVAQWSGGSKIRE